MTRASEYGPDYHKILFYMEQDEHGWPPDRVESLWALDQGDGQYRLDNIPFFVRGVACNDIVAAEQRDDALVFTAVVRHSGHSSIRIIFRDVDTMSATCEHLVSMGCAWEGSGIERLISVDVPTDVDYRDIKPYLDEGEAKGEWDYEEGLIPIYEEDE